MKKFYLLLIMVCMTLISGAQEWIVYDADSLPDAEPFLMTTSNVAGTNQHTNVILPDEDNPGNNVLQLISPEADPGKFMWKYTFTNDINDPLTLVARVKAVEGEYARTMEIDLQQAGYRERLYIKNDNTWELNEADVAGELPFNTLSWHIFRLTKDGEQINLYIDENPEPVASVTAPTTTTENYFRFGDGNGGSTLGGYIDWIIWDTTGTYAPGEGNALPDSLVDEVPAWKVYDAKVLPNLDPLAFVTSNVSGTAPIQATVGNPLDPTDSLLQFVVGATNSRYMWRYNLPATPLGDMTMVVRMKGASDTLDRTMEFDFDYDGLRERLFIRNNGVWNFSETAVNGNLTINPQGWHIYRIVRESQDSTISWYVDENPEPVASVKMNPSGTPTNQYFRWGDGNGSSTLGAYIDWMIWDETGAFAPEMGRFLPDSLITDVQSSDAALDSLGTDVGSLDPEFNPDSMDYLLTVPFGTPEVTLTAVANDPLANVSGDGLVSELPDTVTITVTAEDGFTLDYTVIINVAPPSEDATLASLETSTGELIPAFDPAVTSYALEVPFSAESVTLTAAANDENATVAGDGEFTELPDTATITVTAQAGNTQDYIVVITVAPASEDATLASLTTNVGSLSPDFDPGVTTYSLEVPYSTASVTLTAEANDENASVTGAGTISTLPATATITVTAEAGNSQDYIVNIALAPDAVVTNEADMLTIYPNPANTHVTFKLKEGITAMEIYSFTGNLVERIPMQNHVINLDIADFAQGIYLIKVNAASGTGTYKLIVE